MNPPAAGPGDRRSTMAVLGLALLLLAALIRLLSTSEPFPSWATDPLQMATPNTGVTPVLSLLLDAVALLGAAILFFTRGGPAWWELALWTIGALWAGLHAAFIDGGSLDNLITGSMWTSAIAAGLAARSIAGDPRLASLAGAALLGACTLLAAKGAIQIFIEHAETVSAYRANKPAFLAAQGWSESSPMARAFERRLYQPEATGWLGLSNVYASVMAGCAAALLGMCLVARRDTSASNDALLTRKAVLALLIAGLLAAGAGLAMSGSKGGAAAACAGAVAIAARLVTAPRARRALAIIAISLPLAALGAVALRGFIGERLGELSLLFRWQYLQGAARIFIDAPLLGVGPADFKEAYLLAKTPLNPEEVTSPHSIFFDYAATLGLGGLAWSLLLFLWTPGLARTLANPADSPAEPANRNELRILLLIIAIALLGSAWLERATATLDMTLARLIGVGLWAAVSAAILITWRPGPYAARAAFVCGAVALLTHAQIEVTPVWPGSAMWFFMMLGLASGPASTAPGRRVGAAAFLTTAIAIAIAIPPVLRWERALSDAADSARLTAELREGLFMAESEGPEPRARFATELSRFTGRIIPADRESLRTATFEVLVAQLSEAGDLLERAAAAAPHHFATRRAASRVHLEAAQLLAQLGRRPESDAARARAESTILQFLEARPRSSVAWGWLGVIREGLAQGDPAALRTACDAWERAAALDPYSLDFAPDLARSYRTLGETARAAEWARLGLRNDDFHRLDPVQRLTDEQRRELRQIAGEP